MALVVVWTELAETQLKNIHAYYLFATSPNTADRLADRIVLSTDILKNHPKVGQREELLMRRTEGFRYLVIGHYKIIYWVENDIVNISSVFDCRQDPKKLKELFK